MIQDDDASTGTADAVHFPRHRDRIGHHADHVRRVHDIESVVGELHVRAVHLEQADVAQILVGDAFARPFEHRARKIDASHRAVGRIQRRIDSGAYADLEYAVARLDAHALNRIHSAGMQNRAKSEVVEPRDILVDPRNEVVLNSSD